MVTRESFIKLKRNHAVFTMIKERPNCWLLLTFIALRISREGDMVLGLKPGEAFIGDYKEVGLTRQSYRTSLKWLHSAGIIRTNKVTTKGTVISLANTDFFDINEVKGNHQANRKVTIKQPLTRRKEVKKTTTAYTDTFEQFWSAYPKGKAGRSSKAATFRQWNLRIGEGHSTREMIGSAKAYANSGISDGYEKGAQVFIGQDKWFEQENTAVAVADKPSAFERFCGPHCREANKIKLFKWLDKNPGLTLDAVLAMAIKGEVYISPADEGKLKEWLNG